MFSEQWMVRDDLWRVADEQFELFLASLQSHAGRRTRVALERVELPASVVEARAFAEQTEQLRRVIAVERERWFAEQELMSMGGQS